LPQTPALRFVLARILRIDGFELKPSRTSAGFALANCAALVLAPQLPSCCQVKSELDYGMEDGRVKLPCRQAFLYYTLRRLGFAYQEAPDPLAQQITSKNRDEIQPYIDALSAQSLNAHDNYF
jgi:hypothetical protein